MIHVAYLLLTLITLSIIIIIFINTNNNIIGHVISYVKVVCMRWFRICEFEYVKD